MNWLENMASIATIATATVAVWAYCSYRLTLHRRMKKLEEVVTERTGIRGAPLNAFDLAVTLNCTEDQLIEAAGKSKKIESWCGHLANGREFRLKNKVR